MKKRIFLSLAIAAFALVFATNVNAATIFGSNAAITEATTDAQTTIGQNGITLTAVGGKYTAYVGVKGASAGSLKTARFTVVTSNGYSIDTKTGVVGSGSYKLSSVELVKTDSTTGKKYYYVTLTSTTGMPASTGYSKDNQIATITYQASTTATGDCSLELSPACSKTSTGAYYCKDGSNCTQEMFEEQCEAKVSTCKVETGKDGQKVYYDANGNVTTEADYNANCTKAENPETGSYLPVAIIASALVVAVATIVITKRSKIYHV